MPVVYVRPHVADATHVSSLRASLRHTGPHLAKIIALHRPPVIESRGREKFRPNDSSLDLASSGRERLR
jgi:hypothetical protein